MSDWRRRIEGDSPEVDDFIEALDDCTGAHGDGNPLVRCLREIDRRLDAIEARMEPLEHHKEAADDAAEAATHRPSCKCGYFGHC